MTAYELFQLENYGNILRDSEHEENEETMSTAEQAYVYDLENPKT